MVKTVTYYIVEVRDPTPLACSPEHVEDPTGPLVSLGHVRRDQRAPLSHQDPPGLRRGRRLVEEVEDEDERSNVDDASSASRTMRTPGCSWFSTVPTAAARSPRRPGWRRGSTDAGFDVVTCRDPGGTALGERVREILLDRDDGADLAPGRDAPLHGQPGPARRGGDRAGPGGRARRRSPTATCSPISSIRGAPAGCWKRRSPWWAWWRPAGCCPI